MTATIHAFPGPGPVFGGQAFQDNALDLARAVYAADVPSEVFWLAVATLMESPFEADQTKGRAAYDARLLAQYMAEPELEPAPHASGLIPGWIMAAGVACCIASMMFGGYALQGLGVL